MQHYLRAAYAVQKELASGKSENKAIAIGKKIAGYFYNVSDIQRGLNKTGKLEPDYSISSGKISGFGSYSGEVTTTLTKAFGITKSTSNVNANVNAWRCFFYSRF